jgi:hypothetical protein
VTFALLLAFALGGPAPRSVLSCPSETKHREFRFSDGGREEWCVDRNGMRHGPTESRYPNGVLTSEGEYSSGRVDSLAVLLQQWRQVARGPVARRGDQVFVGEPHRLHSLA